MKRFGIFMMAMLFALSVSAQHVKESKLFDNTYVSLSAGATVPTVDFDVFDDARPVFAVEFGKHITTGYTTGVMFDTRVNTTGTKVAFDEISAMWLHKFNVLNTINGYKDRAWDIYAVAAAGWGHNFIEVDNYGIFATGIEINYNINSTWALKASPQIRWTQAEWGLDVRNSDLSLMVGVVYNFKNTNGTRGFQVCNYDDLMIRNSELNDEINKLRKELAKTKNVVAGQSTQIVELSKVKYDTVYVDNTMMPVIGFKADEFKLDGRNKAYLSKIVEQYKDSKVVVVGYADKNTGDPKYNMDLSMKRAESVKNALVALGMPLENIEVKALGDTEQPFNTNVLNRVVMIVK